MKKALPALAITGCALLACACDLAPVQADAAGTHRDRVYTTGSNIARKPGDIGTPPVAAVGADAAQQQMQLKTVPMSSGGAH